MAVEQLGAMRQAVGKAVKAGRRDEALQLINDFAVSNTALNDAMGDADVAAAIAESKALEAEVQEAFQKDGQQAKREQSAIGKKYWADGQDARRRGSKKGGK